VQRAPAFQPLADDGEGLLLRAHAEDHRRRPVGGVTGGLRHLGQRPAHRLALGQAGQPEQRAQRHDQGDRLVGGQPQRPDHAGGEGHPHPVALEGEVDQVAGTVAGQPAHPQQLEVAPQLALADAEVAGGLGHGHALGAGGQVGHEREQAGHPVGGPRRAHAEAASRVSRSTTASRIAAGDSTRTSAP
jgi:hypothetical protein